MRRRSWTSRNMFAVDAVGDVLASYIPFLRADGVGSHGMCPFTLVSLISSLTTHASFIPTDKHQHYICRRDCANAHRCPAYRCRVHAHGVVFQQLCSDM